MSEEIVKVKADMQCPFCGENATRFVFKNSSKVRCYVCRMPLFLRFIDDDPEMVDERGYARLAYEPFNHNEEVKVLNEVFAKT